MAATEYSLKDRVVTAEDVAGMVIQVSGLSWIRYRVRFDNGDERNLIDGRYLKPAPAKR